MTKAHPQPTVDGAPTVPFRRPMAVGALSRAEPTNFDLRPEPDERTRIAGFLGIRALSELRFKGVISPVSADAWRIEARLTGRVQQSCVVTLEPVTQVIDERITRSYVPVAELAEPAEIELDLDADDEPDGFTDTIDPGRLAIEALALALDPYPRAAGAELERTQFAAPGAEPLTDEQLKPFAGLAALREKLAED